MIGILAAAIVRFTFFGKDDGPTDPFYYILTIYLIPFAGLLLVAQLQWQRVLKYFQFIGLLHGKGLFMIFISLLLFDTKYPVDAALAVFICMVGIFNLVVMCIAPQSDMAQGGNIFAQRSKDKASGSDSNSEEENSDNDLDEHDGLLPRTFASSAGAGQRNNVSNKPQKSIA